MNKIIEKVLVVFLLIQPFLDVIATTNYSILNIIVRGLFLLLIVIYLLFNKKNIAILISTLVSGLILFGINIYFNLGIVTSISNVMKLYYLPITVLFFVNIKNSIDNKIITYVLFIYLILFFCFCPGKT